MAESASLYSPAVEELVALGAAIACNCEPCFKYHFREAMKLGVSRSDVALAVATARKVKDHVAELILKTAEQLATSQDRGFQPGSCCCSQPSSTGEKCC